MLKKYLILSLFTGLYNLGFSQCEPNDSTNMGPNYANDVFYSFANKTVATVSNTNWHLAFSVQNAQPPFNVLQSVSVRVNSVSGCKVKKLLSNANPNQWRQIDTTGLYNLPELIDSDTSWNNSAFTTGYAGNFDFKWGTYNQTTKHVDGTNVYVLYNPTAGWYKKVFIKQLTYDSTWNIIISNLDNTDSNYVKINKKNYTKRLFAYYNVSSNSVIDREPDNGTWDILWTRYLSYVNVPQGSGYYPVTGVLSNKSVTVAKNTGKTCNDIWLSNLKAPYRSNISTIGWDWKKSPPPSWIIVDTFVYFVSAKDGNKYKLSFNGFTGASSGKTYFRASQATLSTEKINSNKSIIVYPNPLNGNKTLNVNTSREKAQIIDALGKTYQIEILNQTIDLSSFSSGLYTLFIQDGLINYTSKIIIE